MSSKETKNTERDQNLIKACKKQDLPLVKKLILEGAQANYVYKGLFIYYIIKFGDICYPILLKYHFWWLPSNGFIIYTTDFSNLDCYSAYWESVRSSPCTEGFSASA